MESRNGRPKVSLYYSPAYDALTSSTPGKSTIYLHQSGASVLSDGSGGNKLNEHVYSDARPEDIDALPDNAPHRSIDICKSSIN